MGALQDDSPNDFDGAHRADSAEDVMCYTSETANDTGGPAFDWGNDDYWDGAANPALRTARSWVGGGEPQPLRVPTGRRRRCSGLRPGEQRPGVLAA